MNLIRTKWEFVAFVSLLLYVPFLMVAFRTPSFPRPQEAGSQPPGSPLYRPSCSHPEIHTDVLLYDLTASPARSNIDCVTLHTTPRIPICIYGDQDFLSRIFRHHGIWENELMSFVMNQLHENPDYGLIDIGANLGYYSLIAAKTGRKVVAVEPVVSNIWRIHKAALLAGTQQNITVINNGISNKREVIPLNIVESNAGGSTLRLTSPCSAKVCLPVQTIYMDDILPLVKFPKAIMKIDIEGYEPRAFQRAQKLFDAVYIPVITMEVMHMIQYCSSKAESEEGRMLQGMIEFFEERGYRPHMILKNKLRTLNPTDCNFWPGDIVWISNRYLVR